MRFHQFTGRGFSNEVLPYTTDEIHSDRVQAIAEFAQAIVNPDDCTVGIAFPQLILPVELLLPDTDREQRAGYAVFNTDTELVEVVFNPAVIRQTAEKDYHFEGCKSIVGGLRQYLVARPRTIILKGSDIKGNYFEHAHGGLNALFHQHEADHVQRRPVTIEQRRVRNSPVYSVESIPWLDAAEEAKRLGLKVGR